MSTTGDLGRTRAALFTGGDFGGTGVALLTEGSFEVTEVALSAEGSLGGTGAALLIRGDLEGRGASLSISAGCDFEQGDAMVTFIFKLDELLLFKTGTLFVVMGEGTGSLFVVAAMLETASSRTRLSIEASLFGVPLTLRSIVSSEGCIGLSGTSGGLSKELDELEDSSAFAFASLASK